MTAALSYINRWNGYLMIRPRPSSEVQATDGVLEVGRIPNLGRDFWLGWTRVLKVIRTFSVFFYKKATWQCPGKTEGKINAEMRKHVS